MRKGLWASIIILMLSLFIAACESSDIKSSNGSDSKSKVTDTDIENAIKAKWSNEPVLNNSNLRVDADVDTNSVTLSGTVETEAARSRAVELAKGARPGVLVTDKIDVKPRQLSRAEYTEEHATKEREKAKGMGERVGATLDDAWVHAKIVAQLISDSDTPERKINVDVVNNVVTLRGTVNTPEQKAEAERIVKGTEGVKKVINQLKVDKNA